MSLLRVGWERRRGHLPQVVHRIMRQVRHTHLLENESLQVIVCFLAPRAVGVADHGGDGVNDRLRAENPILGTWKLQSLVFEAIATGQRSSPFGDHPDGYLSYSPDGRMYAIGVVEDRPKPRDLVPTDEEKVKLQGSMFAYAGTYTADGEKVVHHVDISWNQSWTGTDLVRFYKLDGNTLTITTARAQSAIDGEEGEFILVWEKVQ